MLTRQQPIITFFLIFLMVMLLGCGRNIRPEYTHHPLLYCGWLDLKEGDYKKFGYNSRSEWKIIIERINIYFLQKHVTDYCGSFKVIGATSRTDNPPANAYYVKYNLISVDPEGTAMTVEDKIIESDGKRVLTSFTVRPSGIESMAGVTFMGRMATICQRIAQDISTHIYL
jgi:hypothetical protein